MSKESIFVQIAAYRDMELISTVQDCLSKADNPTSLRFGIVWQHSKDENLGAYNFHPQFKILNVPYQESKGVCWARNKIQSLYVGENYTLQLDSHHRFVKGWDTTLIKMIKDLQSQGFSKPLITSYLPSYVPETDPIGRAMTPWKMSFDRFIPEGAIFFMPSSIERWELLKAPVRARFYSAHFAFTVGQFCTEVPHDPNYYFHGEEISIAVRAYTHGYDLFHPHVLIAWHEYSRNNRAKVWDDDPNWSDRNKESHKRNRCLFSMDGESYDSVEWGPYGFGCERSLHDYEMYAGIDFKRRSVQEPTLLNHEPPNPVVANWESSLARKYKHCLDMNIFQFPQDDYEFWCVTFEKENGEVINRHDVNQVEAYKLLRDARISGSGGIQLWREFFCTDHPHHAVVWPKSKEHGWGTKMIFTL